MLKGTNGRQQEKEETIDYHSPRIGTVQEQLIEGTNNTLKAEMAAQDWRSNYEDKRKDMSKGNGEGGKREL